MGHESTLSVQELWRLPDEKTGRRREMSLKVVTNEKGEAVGEVLTIIC